jgi:hypothetical protein
MKEGENYNERLKQILKSVSKIRSRVLTVPLKDEI